MRILFAISHYFNPSGGGGHASLRDDRQPRIDALTACLAWPRGLFHGAAHLTFYGSWEIRPAALEEAHEVDIIVCTTRGRHLLDQLPLPADFCTHHATNAEPQLLGFECQAVFRERLGEYDYYCYLEDDLVVHDPLFFTKLAWFSEQFGDDNLLQPRLYEQSSSGPFRRLYLDGDIAPQLVEPFRRSGEQPALEASAFGRPVTFSQAQHPHSGCHFLNAAQLRRWVAQPHFLDRDTRFIGPLESAATLGILRTFNIYKPAPSWLEFLEIQHYGTEYVTAFQQTFQIAGHECPESTPPD